MSDQSRRKAIEVTYRSAAIAAASNRRAPLNRKRAGRSGRSASGLYLCETHHVTHQRNFGFSLMRQAEEVGSSELAAEVFRDGCLLALLSCDDVDVETAAEMKIKRDAKGRLIGVPQWKLSQSPILRPTPPRHAIKKVNAALYRYCLYWRPFLDTKPDDHVWLTVEGDPLTADRVHEIVDLCHEHLCEARR